MSKSVMDWIVVASNLAEQPERQRRAFFEMVETFAALYPERRSADDLSERAKAREADEPRPISSRQPIRLPEGHGFWGEPRSISHWGMH